MSFKQFGIFDEAVEISTDPESIDHLTRPINDHARMVYTLLLNKRPVDFFFIARKYGLTKFQTRLAEVLKVYPSIVKKTKEDVPKSAERKVDVTKYVIPKELRPRVMKLYKEVLNVEGAVGKILRGEKHSDFTDL